MGNAVTVIENAASATGFDKIVHGVEDLVAGEDKGNSMDLNDDKLVYKLCVAAEDSYTLDYNFPGAKSLLTLVASQKEDVTTGTLIQWGLYSVNDNDNYPNVTILAFRGTDSAKGLLQDISMETNSVMIQAAVNAAVVAAKTHKPTYVCGHSLGGALAECVCANLGISGAAFNAPGPYSPMQQFCLWTGNKHVNAKFEVHNTHGDPVSSYASKIVGCNKGHVCSKPKWWSNNNSHAVKVLREHMCKEFMCA